MSGRPVTYASLVDDSRAQFLRAFSTLEDAPRDQSALVGAQDLALQFRRAQKGRASGPYQIPPELLAAAPK